MRTLVELLVACSKLSYGGIIYRIIRENSRIVYLPPDRIQMEGLVGQARRLGLAGALAGYYAVYPEKVPVEEGYRACLYQLFCDADWIPHTFGGLRPQNPTMDWAGFTLSHICHGSFEYKHPLKSYPKLPLDEYDSASPLDSIWHSLWLLLNAHKSSELAAKVYRTLVEPGGPEGPRMQEARELFLLPGFAAALCEANISEEALLPIQQLETTRAAAIYVAMRLARPELSHEEALGPKYLSLRGKYPVSQGLVSTLSICRQWFGGS